VLIFNIPKSPNINKPSIINDRVFCLFNKSSKNRPEKGKKQTCDFQKANYLIDCKQHFTNVKKVYVNSSGFRFPTASLKVCHQICHQKTKLMILLRKNGSGAWDRTNDHSAIPGHKVSQSAYL